MTVLKKYRIEEFEECGFKHLEIGKITYFGFKLLELKKWREKTWVILAKTPSLGRN
jgi:hypothetical protein